MGRPPHCEQGEKMLGRTGKSQLTQSLIGYRRSLDFILRVIGTIGRFLIAVWFWFLFFERSLWLDGWRIDLWDQECQKEVQCAGYWRCPWEGWHILDHGGLWWQYKWQRDNPKVGSRPSSVLNWRVSLAMVVRFSHGTVSRLISYESLQ